MDTTEYRTSEHRRGRKPLPVFDKLAFFEQSGYKPRTAQKNIHECDAQIRVVDCGVRWGKSKLAAYELLAGAMRPRKHSVHWIVAPSYELANKVFRELLMAARAHWGELIEDAADVRMTLKIRNFGGGLSEVMGKSSDNPDQLLGEAVDGVVIDEAARVKPFIWESYISQRLLDKRGWAMFISTPKGKNWFHKMWLRGQDRLQKNRVRSWRHTTSENPLIDPAWLEQMKVELPEHVWRQEFLAEFMEGGGLVFRNVMECATGRFELPSATEQYWIGADLAKHYDFTVLTVMNQKGEVIAHDRFNRMDWTIQKQRIKELSNQYNRAQVLMDSTGVGDAIYEDLVRMGVPVKPFLFTEGSKRQLIDNLIVKIENREIKYPPIQELLNELEAYSYEITDSGRLKRSAPSGYHDDCVVSLALAAWQAGRRISLGEVELFGEMATTSGDSPWN